MIEKNMKAPDFTLKDFNGKEYSLSDFLGKKVVLYFYPKDSTPGCTMQANAFNELIEEFDSLNTVIIGISKDSEASHKKFIDKYGLKFLLLSDPELIAIKKYDVWQEKNMYGKITMGVVRSSFIIDETGNVIDAFYKVKAKENASCMLERVKK